MRSTDPYFSFVKQPDGQTETVACDGYGDDVNQYETLLTGQVDDLHIAFNVRDSKLFVAFRCDTQDLGVSHQVSADELRILGNKLLALSLKLAPTGGNA